VYDGNMPRPLSELSRHILVLLSHNGPMMLHQLYDLCPTESSKKKVYDTLFRLTGQGLVNLNSDRYSISEDGAILIHTIDKKRDNIWKIIIFDIPETKRQVRNVLRSKLTSLGFKKWQNSIWISPYTLAPEIEEELNELAKHFFIRLIKTTEINATDDLEAMFADGK
jgi:DNA-binding transcriptional regulator PaaX